MTRVAIVGAGAIGKTGGLVFAQAGYQVAMWDLERMNVLHPVQARADCLACQGGTRPERPGAPAPFTAAPVRPCPTPECAAWSAAR